MKTFLFKFTLLLIFPILIGFGPLNAQSTWDVFRLIEMKKFKNLYSSTPNDPKVGSVKFFISPGDEFTYVWFKDLSGKTIICGSLEVKELIPNDLQDMVVNGREYIFTIPTNTPEIYKVLKVKIKCAWIGDELKEIEKKGLDQFESFKFDIISNKSNKLLFSFTLDGDVSKYEAIDEIYFSK